MFKDPNLAENFTNLPENLTPRSSWSLFFPSLPCSLSRFIKPGESQSQAFFNTCLNTLTVMVFDMLAHVLQPFLKNYAEKGQIQKHCSYNFF